MARYYVSLQADFDETIRPRDTLADLSRELKWFPGEVARLAIHLNVGTFHMEADSAAQAAERLIIALRSAVATIVAVDRIPYEDWVPGDGGDPDGSEDAP